MRDNSILEKKLQNIWDEYFPDVPQRNDVQIRFGKKARKRLGSIREKYYANSPDFDTLILINGHFKDHTIPEFVVEATIAHELCHYAHGFASPLPRLSRFPHRGGSVDREMVRRGIGDMVLREQEWLDANWMKYLKKA